jgi:hypothetical protein
MGYAHKHAYPGINPGKVPPLQGATHISKEYALGLVFYALHRRLGGPLFF